MIWDRSAGRDFDRSLPSSDTAECFVLVLKCSFVLRMWETTIDGMPCPLRVVGSCFRIAECMRQDHDTQWIKVSNNNNNK